MRTEGRKVYKGLGWLPTQCLPLSKQLPPCPQTLRAGPGSLGVSEDSGDGEPLPLGGAGGDGVLGHRPRCFVSSNAAPSSHTPGSGLVQMENSCPSKLHYSSCYLVTTFSPNQDHHAYTSPVKAKLSGFARGSVKKNPPAEDTGSIPDPGRSHMLQSN